MQQPIRLLLIESAREHRFHIIAEIRHNCHYPAAEWRALATTAPLDPALVMSKLRAALDEAEAFVSRLPTAKLGLLFIQGSIVVQPDPEHLDSYPTHAGQRRGHWPSSPEITAAMLERYNQKPNGNQPKPDVF